MFLITSHMLPNTVPEPLLYWNKPQEQQWKNARLQVTNHLKKLEKIVSTVIRNIPLERNQQKIWNQLINKVSAIYSRRFQRSESPAKLFIRPLETFNISLAEMNHALKNNDTFAVYRPVWIETNPCENQSLVWCTFHQPRKFTPTEMTISAFNWVYHRIIHSESLSDLYFLSSYCQALMALGGEEELIELFVPQIQHYIKEIIVPLGKEIYGEISGNQSSSVKKSETHFTESPTRWGNLIGGVGGASIIGLLLFFVLSSKARIKPKSTKVPKLDAKKWKKPLQKSENQSYSKQTKEGPKENTDPPVLITDSKTSSTAPSKIDYVKQKEFRRLK